MEVEEDAEAEKEDLKAREARKRYTVLCIQSHLYIEYVLMYSLYWNM